MISRGYVQTMARYNAWQNRSLYAAADGLTHDERTLERGAFFGSIHKTLSHLMWGDQIWMSRFADVEPPPGGIAESVNFHADWSDLRTARSKLDDVIMGWADTVSADWLDGDLTWYSGAAGRELTKPVAQLVIHFFNHQTHHRGQVHAMLTAAGAQPDDTDLPLMA